MFFGDAVVLDEPFLGPAPESLQAVDVDLAGGENLAVIHFQVPISTEHQAVVTFKLIGIDNGTSADLLDREPQQRFGRHIGNHGNVNNPVPLQDPEDRDLTGRSAATITLALAAKVALIQFDLTAQQSFGFKAFFGQISLSTLLAADQIIISC